MLGWTMMEALQVLREHRLRSFLTMLGIIVGISSVVVMLAVVSGVSAETRRRIENMGSNLLLIYPTSRSDIVGARDAAGSLTMADVVALVALPELKYVAPDVIVEGQVSYKAVNDKLYIHGTTPAYLQISRSRIVSGEGLVENDVRFASRSAVLGGTAAKKLFGDEPAVGKNIRINSRPFRVEGVVVFPETPSGADPNNCIIVPISTAHIRLVEPILRDRLSTIEVETHTHGQLATARTTVSRLLRERHRVRKLGDEDFGVRDIDALGAMITAADKGKALMLAAVGSISLLVGGIGIMNVMLVSVAERTREIGLRKALGATRARIQTQFLVESLVLAVAGCILGVLVGVTTAWILSWLFETKTSITSVSVLSALTVSVAVGVFFGWYPAHRAARLDPVEALRFQ